MSVRAVPLKLRPDHLERRAFIYVRQSTLMQVRENTASTARQYDLVRRAQELGWPSERIGVIDQDQGRSGASTTGRDGFQTLIAEVGLGHAGAVFSLDVSRLARSCSDWYRLLEICALTNTLVIDEDSVYDPGDYNDRLLLGFQGTLSEAELHWLHARLIGGKVKKAEQGQLRFRPPVGFVFDPVGQIVLDPDEEVQHAVQLVFMMFDQQGSALAVVKHFGVHHLRFPNRLWGKLHAGELVWEPLRHARVLSILHNPAYAGAYVYGRTTTRTRTLPGEMPRIKGRTRRVTRAEWPIVLRDAHPSYVTWEQFLRNQERLDNNRTYRAEDHRGVAREGAALLQGIVLCGKCGRRMGVRYSAEGTLPCYDCNRARRDFAAPTCQSMRGDDIDRAVAQAFLEAVQPAQLELSLATLEELEAQAQQIDQQWRRRLERGRYDADLARRRFLAVDPENRLVARTLEREWNTQLSAVEQLEQEYDALPRSTLLALSPDERQRILALASDLPTVWQAPTTTQVERKQLLRFLVKDVTLTTRATTIQISIRWQTNACTEREIPRRPRAFENRRTRPAVLSRIRDLAPSHDDAQIATQLNQEAFTPGLGGTFTASKVEWLRWRYQLGADPVRDRRRQPHSHREDGRYSAREAAELLNVDVSTIAHWCSTGRLEFIQAAPHHPRWITLTPEVIAQLRKPVRQRKPRHTTLRSKAEFDD